MISMTSFPTFAQLFCLIFTQSVNLVYITRKLQGGLNIDFYFLVFKTIFLLLHKNIVFTT